MAGFEPAASCSQSRRDTGLRYIPILVVIGNAKVAFLLMNANLNKEKLQIFCGYQFNKNLLNLNLLLSNDLLTKIYILNYILFVSGLK